MLLKLALLARKLPEARAVTFQPSIPTTYTPSVPYCVLLTKMPTYSRMCTP